MSQRPFARIGAHPAGGGRRLGALQASLRVFLILSGVGLSLVPRLDVPLGLETALAVSLVVLAAALGALMGAGHRWDSAPSLFLAYLAMYHLTTVLTVLYVPGSRDRLPSWSIGWVDAPETSAALLFVAATFACFALGAVLLAPACAAPPAPAPAPARGLAAVGTTCLALGIGLIVFAISTGGGVSRVLEDTTTFRTEVIHGSTYTEGIFLLGLGFVIALASCRRSVIWIPLALFTMTAATLLTSGNRGEALYPALTATVVARRRFRQPSGRVLIVGIVLVVVLVAAVGRVRSVGVAHAGDLSRTPDVRDGLLELGSALRPASLVVTWLRTGDPPLHGASYWLPFERAIGRLLPSLVERKDPLVDPRFVAVQAFQRTGSAMGFSMIAEAAYNFAEFGPLLVFLPLGALLGRMSRGAETPRQLALLGCVLFPLVNGVRNAFIFVPGQVAAGMILVWFAGLLDGGPAGRSRSSASYGRQTLPRAIETSHRPN